MGKIKFNAKNKYVVDWTPLSRDGDQWWALMNPIMNLRVPQDIESFLSGWATVGFPGRYWHHGVGWLVIGSIKFKDPEK
jgi:hypothetical protein